VPIHANSWQKRSHQQNSCQKKFGSAFLQPQFAKFIKTHRFSLIFNQNHTTFHQNHIKTTLLFNTFRQNLSPFAFSRCRVFSLNQRAPGRWWLEASYCFANLLLTEISSSLKYDKNPSHLYLREGIL